MRVIGEEGREGMRRERVIGNAGNRLRDEREREGERERERGRESYPCCVALFFLFHYKFPLFFCLTHLMATLSHPRRGGGGEGE